MQFDDDALQAVRESRLLIDEYDAWIMEELKPFLGQKIIEIGCGLGNLLRHFVDRDLVVGIDISSEAVADLNRTYADFNNVSVYQYNITESSVMALQKDGFDSAVSLNVLEHIEDDELAMYNIAQLLMPGGHFVLIVPAHQWLYGTMDSSIGHYRRYTKASAREKLEKAGFNIVCQKYLNMVGAIGWLVNGRLFRRTVPPSGQLQVFNKIVPTLKAAERMMPALFGISLMTVAQRKVESN